MGRATEWDAVVCGGGAAGLVLASELVGREGPLRSVLVVDDGRHPVESRTWAFWADRPTLVDPALTRTWRRLEVHAAGTRTRLDLRRYSYRLVDGTALVAAAARRASEAGGRLVRLPGHVDAVATTADAERPCAEAVVDGTTVSAGWAFDSRPPPPPAPESPRMRFVGHEVTSSRPAFDPDTATFLDFRAGGPGQVRFGYVLPLTERRALVDVVTFSAGPDGGAGPGDVADADGGDDLDVRRYVTDVLGVPDPVLRLHERSDLPLRHEPPRGAGGRVMRVGRSAGMLKPSTGFAFDRILRDSERIAVSLRRHGHPFHRWRRHARHRLLDRVLLDVVEHEPDRVADAFAALFARNPPRRVLRFLDEDTSVVDELALVTTLPPGPFVRAAGRLLRPGRPSRQTPPDG